jgi:hypothetical protein
MSATKGMTEHLTTHESYCCLMELNTFNGPNQITNENLIFPPGCNSTYAFKMTA